MSGYIKAFGSLYEGEAAAQAQEYNASIARRNADIAQQQSAAAVQAQQRSASRAMGAIKANYGASGVQMDGGSPLDVLADSVTMATLDKLTIEYNYALKAQGLQQQANLSEMAAKTARTSSYFNAAADIMDSASQSAKQSGGSAAASGG